MQIDVLENTIPVEKKTSLLLSVGRPVVAMAMIGEWEKPVPYVHSVFVAKGHRRKGLGRAIVREAVRRAADAGKVALSLWVDAKNKAARALYEREGFVVVQADEGKPVMMSHPLQQKCHPEGDPRT